MLLQEINGKKLSLFITPLVIITCAKFLLIPAYRSTDFDVHRNWLAITHHLPVSQWYFDDNNKTTVHTLDYPPLFALFEAFLSNNPLTRWAIQAEIVDQRCFELLPDNDNEPTDSCIFFQRLTVILSDSMFVCGAILASHFVHGINKKSKNTISSDSSNSDQPVLSNAMITTLLIILNPGIILLDHVHFQYNGMLLGLLLISIGFMARSSTCTNCSFKENNNVIAAIFFAALLTMKHLYLTLAPLYFIYLLRYCCFHPSKKEEKKTITFAISINGFTKLAICTLVTLLLPFLPFLMSSYRDELPQMSQMLKRLFPFARGLCHDYWAANVWALYLFADKCLSFISRKILGHSLELAEIGPSIAAISLLVSLVPALIFAWHAAGSLLKANISKANKIPDDISNVQGQVFFIHGVVYCSFCSFMLAYHVHEKAIMTAIIPMTLLAPVHRQNAQLYLRTCALGHFGLLPLLYKRTELLFKTSSYIAHFSISVFLLEYAMMPSRGSLLDFNRKSDKNGLITLWDKIGLFVLSLLLLFSEVIHPILFQPKQMFEFLPLMMISVVCAIGLVGCWIHSGFLMKTCTQQLVEANNDNRKID